MAPEEGSIVRDCEPALETYDPTAGRTFVATDADVRFVADGTRWHYVPDDTDHRGAINAGSFTSVSPPIGTGPNGFAAVNHDTRSRLVNYEAGYTKPVFHWSFDGGATNNYAYRQVFEKLDITPTLAISPSFVGDDGRMSWQQLRELQTEYGWNVSNHGHRHERFDEIGPEQQEREVLDAIDAFRRHGVGHDHYMYSWGMAGGQVGRSIVANVYPFAWGTVHAPNADGIVDVDSPYGLPRVLVERESRDELEAAIGRAIDNETGMVLFGHNVFRGESVDERGFETSVDRIEHLTEYVRENGGEWVESVDQVVQYSRTPVRISAGDEPVRIDDLRVESVRADTVSRGAVGANVYQSTVQTVPPDGQTTVAFDSSRHDHCSDFDADSHEIDISRPGTYAITGTIHVEPGAHEGTLSLHLRAGGNDEAVSTVDVNPDSPAASTSVQTHLQLRRGATLGLEVDQTTGDELVTIPGRETAHLSVSRLG